MNLTPVKSSNLEAIGHDPVRQTLAVQFKNGKTFEYAGVTPELHQQLIAAPSVGAFFGTNIRPKFKGVEAK